MKKQHKTSKREFLEICWKYLGGNSQFGFNILGFGTNKISNNRKMSKGRIKMREFARLHPSPHQHPQEA